MEKKFKIKIAEELSTEIIISAHSEEEAINQAYDLYKQEFIVLDSNDFKGFEISSLGEVEEEE